MYSLLWTLYFIITFFSVWRNAVSSDDTGINSPDISKMWTLVTQQYLKYESTTKMLRELESSYSDLVRIYSVGKSVQGREMWVINIRTNVRESRKLLQPPMKIVANMHGDETIGRSLVLMLAVDLVSKFQTNDSRAVRLLEATDIHLMPSVNPDGFEAAREGECGPSPYKLGRRNANRVDLNRNFPDQFLPRDNTKEGLYKMRQPETLHMMNFITRNNFVLSVNLHAGALVACYPYDSTPLDVKANSGVKSLSPDNDFFVYLAKLYARNHKTMTNPDFQCTSEKGMFKDGISNGAHWYNVRGGMQDFNYAHSNCFEITLELSCCKYPKADTLAKEWDLNQEALYKLMEATHLGVRGLVISSEENGAVIPDAKIIVEGIDYQVSTTGEGEYWRLLIPGKYRIKAEAEGYLPSDHKEVEVGPVTVGEPTVLNFTLEPGEIQGDGNANAKLSIVGSLFFAIVAILLS